MTTRTLALINHKPGTAKTTSAVFLASAFMARGARVLLVDADPAGSALSWADLAGGFPWDVIGLADEHIDRKLFARIMGGKWDRVIIDCPQLEDHAKIGRAAMRHAEDWVMPIAPAGVEFDRAIRVRLIMDEVQAELTAKGLTYEHPRWALLNRTNRRNPSKTGPDTQMRRILSDLRFRVFRDQVETADDRYRQVFGTVVDAYTTPYLGMAVEMEEATSECAQAN